MGRIHAIRRNGEVLTNVAVSGGFCLMTYFNIETLVLRLLFQLVGTLNLLLLRGIYIR